jgi:hypothetical protein
MNPFKDLFKVRRKRNYDVRSSIMDDRKHIGNDYRTNVLKNSLSRYIQRSAIMNDFVMLVQHTIADLIDAVSTVKVYKSFTVKKNDKKVR